MNKSESNLQELLEKHLALVIEANKKINITRIDDWEQGKLLHVEDSLIGLNEVEAAPEGRLADLGSGAGFPGIPLALATGRQVTLVESVGKKAALLQEFVRALELEGSAEVYPGRAEALSRTERSVFSVVTARALSSLPSLMELASPLLQEGGRLVCYKSADIGEELEWALRLQEKLALWYVSARECALSDSKTRRILVVFEKRGEATVPLPRREGKAQNNPYRN